MRVIVAQVLVNTELVTGFSTGGLCEVVHRSDTRWSDSIVAELKLGKSKEIAKEHWKSLEKRWELAARLAVGDTESALVEGVLSVSRLTLPGWRIKLDTWCDVVDVLAQVLRHVISVWRQNGSKARNQPWDSLVTRNILVAGAVLVKVIVCVEKLLCYLDWSVELQPLLIGGKTDAIDVVRGKPFFDRVHRGLCRGKDLVDLFRGVVFAVVWRRV